jgi:hypothetical protein
MRTERRAGMENLISTIVFVIPGFMMYFWVQMMGINPVVKHTPIEFGALSALAWFPVVATTLGIMNLYHTHPVTTLEGIKAASSNVSFLLEFMAISVVSSYIISAIYVIAGYPIQQWAINRIRISNGKAKLSKSPSVWEEVFITNSSAIVGIGKLGSDKPDVYGCAVKAARPFEAKRAFKLIYVEYVTKLINKYEIPVSEIYSDIDSGVNVYLYDMASYAAADEKEREEPEYIQTPSRSRKITS